MIKKHNWYIQNRQGDVNNSIGNGEAKELLCMTHIHELWGWGLLEGRGNQVEGAKEEKVGTIVIA